jgi:hypothetical protein
MTKGPCTLTWDEEEDLYHLNSFYPGLGPNIFSKLNPQILFKVYGYFLQFYKELPGNAHICLNIKEQINGYVSTGDFDSAGKFSFPYGEMLHGDLHKAFESFVIHSTKYWQPLMKMLMDPIQKNKDSYTDQDLKIEV